MSTQPPLRQYSPDGRFWWDGAQWQPVAPPPPPPLQAPPLQPPPLQAPPFQPPPLQAPHRGRTRFPAALLLIGPLLAGVLVGAIGGKVAASVAGGQSDGPTAPPVFTDSFPNADQRYLPGLTVSAISREWLVKGNKYTCGPTDVSTPPVSGAKNRMDCTAPGDAKYDLEVDIEYDDETHVRMVIADCGYGPGANACRSLFANLADAVLAGRSGQRKQAQDWAAKNVDTDNATVVGEVQLMVSLEPHKLYCAPAV